MTDTTQFWDMIEKFDTAMVVTRDGQELRARPMALKLSSARDLLLFITDLDSHKVDEIEADDRVALSFTRHGEYVSVSGRARVSTDKALIDDAWDAEAEAWMPQGKDGPGVAVLAIEPTQAEIWDVNTSKVRQAYEFARAYLGGKDRPDVSHNEKLDL
ncbi:pyridoxamine 5'-phosphate oxidase family protein [Aureimonas frigidaquae]|uniref:pyridoxamine 5'-phosphate oxidase family protein n=1 Tax=Aureimonas frigidaquae TaxID=424757 RepID=UPI000780C7DE|nr:pyridoxamine 5'-phosphate oxidase family protein [Aureimonas frigidaquae]